MLNQNHFFFNTTRKYVVAMAHILNDIHVIRIDSNGSPVKDIKVPITYAGKNKLFQALQKTPDSSKVSTVLPRITFLITSMQSDYSRKINNLIEIPYSTINGVETFQFSPTPYNFTIDMVAWSKHMDDLLQICEQVCVFFNPYYTIKIKEIPELNLERNITITLNDVNFDISEDIGFEETRTLMANFNFTLKGFIYPPIKNIGVIEYINTQIRDFDFSDNIYANIETSFNELTQNIDSIITEGPNAIWPD